MRYDKDQLLLIGCSSAINFGKSQCSTFWMILP